MGDLREISLFKMKPEKKPHALIVHGGWEGHEPEACAKRIAAWLRQRGFRVSLSKSLDVYLDRRRLARHAVIVPIWTMGEISPEQAAGLMGAVAAGVGLAGWHGGMCDSFRAHTGYQFMTGGQFVSHPGGIIPYRVQFTEAGHKDPLTRGLNDFEMRSEQYYMHTDPGNEVLATTEFSGKHGDCSWIRGTVMLVTWKRAFGKGRVFYTSLGHVAAEFDVPEFFEMVKRGIQWAARLRVVSEYRSRG